MATVTVSSAENALKSYYLDAIKEELDNKISPFLAAIEKTSNDVYGKEVVRVIQTGLNGGVGVGDEDGNLPRANGNRYMKFTAPLKNIYGTIQISDKALRASSNNSGAVVDLLNAEMEGLVKSAKYTLNKMIFGSSNASNSSIVSVMGADTVIVNTLKGLEEGMVVDIEGAEDRFKNVAITKISRFDKVVIFDREIFNTGEIGLPSTKKIFIQGSTMNNNLQLTGLDEIISDAGTLYGVERTESDYMRSYVATAIGELTEEKFADALDEVENNAGEPVNMIICSIKSRKALKKALLNNVSLTMAEGDINGGKKVLTYNGIPVVVDSFCPDDTIYLVNTNDFELHQLCDWEWMQGENGEILKQVPGKPVYTATLVKYAELICTKPCGQGVLKGIN